MISELIIVPRSLVTLIFVLGKATYFETTLIGLMYCYLKGGQLLGSSDSIEL